MASPTTTTKTKTQLWQVDCAPECGFMVRDHNQKSLTSAVMNHTKWVHNQNTTEQQALGMAKKV